MPSVSVATYQLRYHTDAVFGFSRTVASIILIAQPGSGPVSDVTLAYQQAGNAGFFNAPLTPNLIAFFPPELLETHLSICQSESPLFVQWEVDPLSALGKLTQFTLMTGEEFFGEDLIDTSP